MKFGTILIDPPWPYDQSSGRGGVDHQYVTPSEEWLRGLPLRAVAASDCALLCWATWPKIELAVDCIRTWGFKVKTGMPWVKMTRRGVIQMGCGHHVRAASEMLLLAVRGDVSPPPPSLRPLGVLFCGRSGHSRKPDTQYEIAENYPGPYIEVFARPQDGLFGPRPNWVLVGQAVDDRDAVDVLLELGRLE